MAQECSHSAASDAFQEVKKAYDALLDPNKRRITAGLVHVTLREVRRERRKAVARLEAAGLFGELARLPALAEVEAREVRKAFADVEHRKATYEARIKAIAAREAEEAAGSSWRRLRQLPCSALAALAACAPPSARATPCPLGPSPLRMCWPVSLLRRSAKSG
jgi:curved DNA-binding protein CbpA